MADSTESTDAAPPRPPVGITGSQASISRARWWLVEAMSHGDTMSPADRMIALSIASCECAIANAEAMHEFAEIVKEWRMEQRYRQ